MTPGAAPLARRGALVVALWLAGVAAALVVAWRAHYVADLSAFLPSAPTPEQAVLLDQLKSGATSRLLVIGIEGGAPGDDAAAVARAEASKRVAAALRASGAFASVHNGENAAWADAGRFLFDHRYAISPAVDAERFARPACARRSMRPSRCSARRQARCSSRSSFATRPARRCASPKR